MRLGHGQDGRSTHGDRDARRGGTEKGAPVSLETIVVPDPGPGEAVVAVKACGVCHTDLHYREGGINDDFPFLLGPRGRRRRRGGRARRQRTWRRATSSS